MERENQYTQSCAVNITRSEPIFKEIILRTEIALYYIHRTVFNNNRDSEEIQSWKKNFLIVRKVADDRQGPDDEMH